MIEIKRINALDGLKGISAIFIAFFYHYSAHFYKCSDFSNLPFERYLGFFYENGFLAVELFFMISGFTMYLTYWQRIQEEGINFYQFIKRRIKALMPLTIITLIVVAIGQLLIIGKSGKPFVDENFNILNFIKNILMLEGSVFNEYSFNLPVWFVSALFLCYCLFYFVAHVEKRTSRVYGIGLCIILIAIGWVAMLYHFEYPLLGSEFASRGYVTFFLGVLICRAFLQGNNLRVYSCMCLVFSLVSLVSFAVKYLHKSDGVPGQGVIRIVSIWILYPFIIMLCVHKNAFSKLLEMKVFRSIGNISNYIFYWHFPIQVFLVLLFSCFGITFVNGYILMPLYTAIVLGVSYGNYMISKRLKLGVGVELKQLLLPKDGRICWIDSAKGIGILLVAFAHLGIGKIATSYLNSFYMPLFFFLSGCVFSPKRDFKTFLIRKIKTIILPYFALGVPMLFFVICSNYSNWSDKYTELVDICLQFLVQERCWTIWFLTCLFVVNIVYYVLNKFISNDFTLGIVILAITTVGLIYYRLGGMPLPWNIDAAPVAILFFFMGNVFYKNREKINKKYYKTKWLIICALLHIGLWIMNLKLCGQGLEMFYSQYGIPPLTLISAISGVLVVIICSSYINACFLRYLGQNSLLYFAWHHTIVIPIIRRIMAPLGLTAETVLGTIPLLGIRLIEFILTVLILTILNLIISNTRLKFMVAK